MAGAEEDRPFYVRSSETVLLSEKPSRGYAFSLFLQLGSVWIVLGIGGSVAAGLLAPAWLPVVIGVTLAGLAGSGVFAWRRRVTSEYIVTDQRVYARVGRWWTRVHLTSHDRVSDLHYRQGVWDRLFGVGHVFVSTAGGDVRIAGVADAIGIQETLATARDDLVTALLEEGGLPEQAARALAKGEGVQPSRGEGEETGQAGREVSVESVGLERFTGKRPVYVRSGEDVVWWGRPSPRFWLLQGGGMTLGIAFALAGFLAPLLLAGPFFLPVLPLVLIALVVLAVPSAWAWLHIQRTELAITDRRVYLRQGVVSTSVNQLAFEKITDIGYDQNILMRLLDLGSVTVNTAGSVGAPITAGGFEDAMALKTLLEEASAGHGG